MSYSVSLDKFEGPLDLLLHLIEKAELDIEDIFVSQITSQYLEYIKDINSIDMDKASEFLTVAAQLMLIKSRRLLPRPPVLDSNEEDPEQILIQQLKDYKLFKAAGQDLQQLYLQASKSLTRLPEDVALPPQRIEIENMDINNLYLAFARVLDRANQASPPDNSQSVRADSFTVRRQIIRVDRKSVV